ncbi:hypothetical protein AMS68_007815 [Peltaster fructicola]|uniref:WD-like domain-containing protein n=1 Tax=Peltaster fructicola TaxID=286661 RepID=A0A6H0Y622_9PEZI|nr:hypothetical protein AMS68_007815 [Peltaster fructicola]
MQPQYIAVLLAAVSGVMASPLPDASTGPKTGYIEHFREPGKFTNGSLIWFGPAANHTTRSLDERASCSIAGDAPKCDSSHTARNNVCDSLITELNGDGATGVPTSPRQICYLGDSESNEYCCVSWHNPVNGLTKGDLATPANTIMTQCTQNGISGKVNNIYLRGRCTAVCLSNRGTGC